GNAYLLNRANLGGGGVMPLAILQVGGTIITAAVAYTTPNGSYVVFKGSGVGCPNMTTGAFTAIKVSATSPPRLSIAWCAGAGAPGGRCVFGAVRREASRSGMTVWISLSEKPSIL